MKIVPILLRLAGALRGRILILGSGTMIVTIFMYLEKIMVQVLNHTIPLIFISLIFLLLLFIIYHFVKYFYKKLVNPVILNNDALNEKSKNISNILTIFSVISTILSLLSYSPRTGDIVNNKILHISKVFSLDEKLQWLETIKKSLNLSSDLWNATITNIDLHKINSYNELLTLIKTNLEFINKYVTEINQIKQNSNDASIIMFIRANWLTLSIATLAAAAGIIIYFNYSSSINSLLREFKNGILTLIDNTNKLASTQWKNIQFINKISDKQIELQNIIAQQNEVLTKLTTNGATIQQAVTTIQNNLKNMSETINQNFFDQDQKINHLDKISKIMYKLNEFIINHSIVNPATNGNHEELTAILVELAKAMEQITKL